MMNLVWRPPSYDQLKYWETLQELIGFVNLKTKLILGKVA